MNLAKNEAARKPLNVVYAIGYSLLYGLLPVFWWGAKDWRKAGVAVLTMASVQMAIFYLRAKRETSRKKEVSRVEQIAWLAGHVCILGGYAFAYHAFVSTSSVL